ncbi:MAG: NHLP leader peptide family RiPP precursor [Actinomycetes bacterium]
MDAHENPLQSIIAKCWEDGAFKERLLADPDAVLKNEGVEIPEGVTINVVEDTAQVRTLVIPAPAGRMDDAALDAIAAAGGGVAACTADCWLSGMGNLW